MQYISFNRQGTNQHAKKKIVRIFGLRRKTWVNVLVYVLLCLLILVIAQTARADARREPIFGSEYVKQVNPHVELLKCRLDVIERDVNYTWKEYVGK